MFAGRQIVASFIAIMALASGCKKDDEVTKFVPERQGSRGESCLITNDCKSGLLCIANTCISDDFALEASAKVCVVAQCIDTTDCCKPQSPQQMETCNELQEECAQSPGSFSCSQFETSCTCKLTCTDHTCVSTETPEPECQMDSDCFGTERCLPGGVCGECGADSDCGTGFICQVGQCARGCLRDEACGALSKCNAGRCEDRNCLDNRECVAFLERPDAVCNPTGQCSIPCEDNAGCASLGGLFSCSEGSCVYAGCLTNAECAASDQEFPSTGLRLCLDKAEAEKVRFGGF